MNGKFGKVRTLQMSEIATIENQYPNLGRWLDRPFEEGSDMTSITTIFGVIGIASAARSDYHSMFQVQAVLDRMPEVSKNVIHYEMLPIQASVRPEISVYLELVKARSYNTLIVVSGAVRDGVDDTLRGVVRLLSRMAKYLPITRCVIDITDVDTNRRVSIREGRWMKDLFDANKLKAIYQFSEAW